ncbi:hypothetical protein Pcac1_g26726 [Phytophthora cactorum]|nr:hypothetical protein Pcac1_g26726 [Phytophthora cactorum]
METASEQTSEALAASAHATVAAAIGDIVNSVVKWRGANARSASRITPTCASAKSGKEEASNSTNKAKKTPMTSSR